jgi:hypothetical protein
MSTALTDTSKLNLSFKKVLGKAQTSNIKDVSNEGIGSNISMAASTIFGYEPPTPVSSSYYTILGGVAEMVSLVATPMAGTKDDSGRYQAFALSLPADYQTNSSNPKKGTGFYLDGQVLNETTGTLQIIPPSFGANYTALVYHTASGTTQIPALDARDWVLDYYNGIFFQQDPPSDTDENPAYVDAFIYIGDYALSRLSGSGQTPGGATTDIQFNDAGAFSGSSNLTFNGTTLAVVGDVSASINVSASAFYGDGSNLTGITASAVEVADGPVGSLQFRVDTPVSGEISGSATVLYETSTPRLTIDAGLVHNRTAVSTVHTASVSEYILGVTAVPTEILFDATLFTDGQVLVVKDESGAASASDTILLNPSASQTIDGAADASIESPYGSVLLYSNGTNWFIY